MKITEFDKEILSGIKENEIYNEFSFIQKFINHTTEKKSDGYEYYTIEDSKDALEKYTSFIQIIGYLEEQKMIRTIDVNTSNDNVEIEHRTKSKYSIFFDNYRSAYRNRSIIKFVSLDSFIENNYRTDFQREFDFNQEVHRDSNERYLSEKKLRNIYQIITIIIALITAMVSLFSILASIGVFSKGSDYC